ncbi:MAG: YfhO family protein, partial [Anaerolineae bacterium]
IEVETKIDQPGWLVVSELWYPGWQAQVNGAPQPVERVNGLLRGVYLAEAGQHRVSLKYEPETVRWGSWISGITLGLVIILGILAWRQTRRSTP